MFNFWDNKASFYERLDNLLGDENDTFQVSSNLASIHFDDVFQSISVKLKLTQESPQNHRNISMNFDLSFQMRPIEKAEITFR